MIVHKHIGGVSRVSVITRQQLILTRLTNFTALMKHLRTARKATQAHTIGFKKPAIKCLLYR